MLASPDPGIPGTINALARIRQQLVNSSAQFSATPNLLVTFSAGITEFRDGEGLHETLERADRALYQAKADGRDRDVVLSPRSRPPKPDTSQQRNGNSGHRPPGRSSSSMRKSVISAGATTAQDDAVEAVRQTPIAE